jgi:hypothetical protein
VRLVVFVFRETSQRVPEFDDADGDNVDVSFERWRVRSAREVGSYAA